MRINIGDKVAYSVQFLRSTCTYTGPLPFARGTVTEIQGGSGWTLATIDWGDSDIPSRVNVANLAIVGNNSRFAG